MRHVENHKVFAQGIAQLHLHFLARSASRTVQGVLNAGCSRKGEPSSLDIIVHTNGYYHHCPLVSIQ